MNPRDIVLGVSPAIMAKAVKPTSIEFLPMKNAEREGEQIIVDDLGPASDRHHQNVRPGFWRGRRL